MRIDLLRATGVRYAMQRRREEERLSALARDPKKSAYRVIWQEAADDVGAELSVVSGEFLELRSNGARARVWRHWVPLDDAVTLRLALDKLAVHELLMRARPAAARAPRVRRPPSSRARSSSSRGPRRRAW